MASICHHCSAPVDRRTGFCGYCRTRLELDLHGGLEGRLYEADSERICPHCDIKLDTIDLKIDKKFLIEKCSQCHGLFFDPGELEMLLERSVSNVFHVDQQQLNQLQNKHFQARSKGFKYIKCPACQVIMNRVAFGYRSGVIVNHCKKHGFWLDEGELRQLQEWKKAGGEMLQKQRGKGFGHEPKPDAEATYQRLTAGQTVQKKTSWSREVDNLDVIDLLSGIFS